MSIPKLRLYLSHLPCSLPIPNESTYRFHDFGPDPSWVADVGEAGAVNRELEIRLGSRSAGLEQYTAKLGDSVIFAKWIEDLTYAAETAITYFAIAQLPTLGQASSEASPTPATVVPPTESASSNSKQKSKPKRKPPVKRNDTKVLDSFEDSDYIDTDEELDTRQGGVKMHPLLKKVSKICHPATDLNETVIRCIASSGCHKTFAHPRNLQRVFTHTSSCGYLPMDDRVASEKALLDRGEKGGQKRPRDDESTERGGNNDETSTRALKRTKEDAGTSAAKAPFVSKEGLRAWKDERDKDLVKFFVCNGIPPLVADSDEFKAYSSGLNSKYTPPSTTTLSDKHIFRRRQDTRTSLSSMTDPV